ncbi:MAG: chromate transporter [Clostridia bacterium]|nr:chromate transporter [Clostridia bacterium]
MTFLMLFWEFFKTGLFAVGGGLATLPFLRDIAGRYEWFTLEQLSDMIAVSEATPGPVGVNMATYAGFNAAYILGALTATLALVLPAFIIACTVARFLKKYNENRLVKGAFYALRPATAAIVVSAVLQIFLGTMLNLPAIGTGASFTQIVSLPAVGLFALVLAGVIAAGKKVHPLVFIAAGAAAGILLKL